MKKTMLILTLGGLSTGALAAPGFPFLPANRGQPTQSNCVDFSGVWKGSCVKEDGTTYEDAVRVAQDGCDSIQFGLLPLVVGGTFRAGVAWPGSDAGDIEEVLAFDWNQAHDRLVYKKTGSGRSLGGGRFTDEGAGYLGMENGELVLNVDQSTTSDGQVKRYTLVCKYGR